MKQVNDVEIEQTFTQNKMLRIIASDEKDLESKIDDATQGDARRMKAAEDWNVTIVAIHGVVTLPDAQK